MGRSFANQAPNNESHPIHPTQELPGSALSQAIEIDSLRYAIEAAPRKHRARYLYALFNAASHCAAAPGHFAQYLIPRDRTTSRYVARLRKRSILDRFLSTLDDFPRQKTLSRKKNRTFQSDATRLLLKKTKDFAQRSLVIYADPPYSKSQYSRYYHVLETLALYDYPDCANKGRYRADRFHTDFSRKAGVIDAMDDFIEAASNTGAPLYISYPTNGLITKAGGSVIDLLKKHYPNASLITREPIDHSTMGGASGTASTRVLEDIYYGGWKAT